MSACRCRNGDVGKARCVTTAAGQVGQRPGDLRRCGIESQHPIAVEMQYRSQPRRQDGGLPFGAFAPGLRDAIGYLRNCNRRQEKIG